MSFALTEKQLEAQRLLTTESVKHLLLYGGAQSAKTFFALYVLLIRALKYPASVQSICRLRLVDLKSSIILTKFPEVVKARFGELGYDKSFIRYVLSYPSFVEFGNGSKIFFLGLEDNRSFEKVLSPSYSGFLIDEASEVPYLAYSKLLTRLSQNNSAKKISICTLNPPSQRHWTYQLFFNNQSPVDKTQISNPQSFAYLQMNPKDNLKNLPEDYIQTLEGLPEQEKERFLYGRYSDNLHLSVFGLQIKQAEEEGRFGTKVEIDPDHPIYAVFDLGINDATSVWIVQFLQKQILFLNYYETIGSSILDVFKDFIFNLAIPVAGVYLPHDSRHRWVGSGTTVEQLLRRFSGNLPSSQRFFITVLPQMKVWQSIHACRIAFSRCIFDRDGCYEGVEALREYKFAKNEKLDIIKSTPLHDWASHCADAFRYVIMAYNYQQPNHDKDTRDDNNIYFDKLYEERMSR
ncbi:MAG: phage terminase large subunit [Endomicrobium sp.]|jgi:hypothetical protein|nr:phage terminase large subunit [Endomicrobium sp.]